MPNDSAVIDSVSNGSGNVAANGYSTDKTDIANIVAEYGHSSATAWLEFERYKIWRPSESESISQSSFPPVQGYMRKDPYVFAWGNPLVSDPSALEATVKAFIKWVESQDLRLLWCCGDGDLSNILGEKFRWSTVNCIYEDVVDPAHVLELTSPEAKGQEGGGSAVKDLKKNLRRAEKADILISEVKWDEWSEQDKKEVEDGIEDWRNSRGGVQIASTSLQPWLDAEHRRYWVARKDGKAIGLIILSAIGGSSYQIKNALSFPKAPKGTSESLIYTAVKALHDEEPNRGDESDGNGGQERVTATFGITAADQMKPVDNVSGWKISWLSKTYNGIASATGLMKRGDFRSKFASNHEAMYVCYPSDEGFGLDGINTLMKLLKK